jgi:putative ABC transport system permease protein
VRLWLRYALLNLRSGLRGFWIFLTCLTLGVAAIAIIGSLGTAVDRGLAEQGQPLLGGDLEFSLVQREANDKERAYIDAQGTVSKLTTLRAMATAHEKSTLIEIKAVDANYPLYGTLVFDQPVNDIYSQNNNHYGIAVDALLLGRLGLVVGDKLRIGTADMDIRATIKTEPDRISDGIVFGPRVLLSHEALATTGLIQPGSLITWRYRVKMHGDTSLAAAKKRVDDATAKFPDAGWRVRARDNAANGAERFVERLGYFMTLVSVAALVTGGAGIANAVAAFVNRRTQSIATLKCLGISSRDVFGIFLCEILLVGSLGIATALALGAAAPAILKTLAGHILPLPVTSTVEIAPLLFAGSLGYLITAAFAIWPLARIANISGVALFRQHLDEGKSAITWRYIVSSLIILLAAAALVLFSFEEMRVTAIYLAGLAASFLLLAGLAWILIRAVQQLPQPQNILLRHAMQSLYRPGSSSLPVIMALGLGLSLFVTLALTDRTISTELRSGIPEKAPAFFFIDVKNTELAQFRDSLKAVPGVIGISNAPMMRGRIAKVKGIPSDKLKADPEVGWALKGDRGLTYAETLPEGSKLLTGTWWPTDYAGPPLVSMVADIAKGLDLTIGDKITVNVLGRDIEATVANLREVNWRSMGINFVMVFSPNTLKAAPHSHIVTVQMEHGDEAALLNRTAAAYPSVTAVRVKDALAIISDLLGKMMAAVRAANVLALLTGVLVLAGALAAGLSTRSYEAVVLKTYGATRRQLLTAFAMEYGILGLVAAIFGVAIGSVAAWALAKFVLEMPFSFDWTTAILTAISSMILTIAAGLIVTHRALSAKPSHYLRNE